MAIEINDHDRLLLKTARLYYEGGLTQAQISLDWLGLTAREYAAAAELAGERGEGKWSSPPRPGRRRGRVSLRAASRRQTPGCKKTVKGARTDGA